jgi:hypothetical protein
MSPTHAIDREVLFSSGTRFRLKNRPSEGYS